MNNINVLIETTLQAKSDSQKPRNYLGASSLGDACDRRIQYQYMGIKPDTHFTGKQLQTFAMGHALEDLIVDWLRLAGFDLSNRNKSGEQYGFSVVDGKDAGQLTMFYQELLEDIKSFKPDLVILDTVADLFGGNENNRSQVRQFVQNCCARIARAINGAVLLCAHPSDSGIQRKTGTGGSTAWNNTVRSRWYFSRASNQENGNTRILSRKKSNYGPMQEDLNLEWQDGVFVPTGGFSPDYLKQTLIEAIKDAASDGAPFTHTGDPGLFKQCARLPVELHTLSRHKIEVLANELYARQPSENQLCSVNIWQKHLFE